MKYTLFAILLGITLFHNSSIAQGIQFDQVPALPPERQEIANFLEVYSSATDYADVDNDGDMDVMIMGRGNLGSGITRLYINDGTGNFTPSNSTFLGADNCALDFGDVDGDNDLDLIFIGTGSGGTSNFYLNDGAGNFTNSGASPIPLFTQGTVNFFDMENDGDNDLLVTGWETGFGTSTRLYENDGAGGFTEVIGIPIDQVRNSAVVIADIDGNNYMDIFISGQDSGGLQITKLFKNTSGVFIEEVGNSFTPVQNSSMDLADVDNDLDLDLILSGWKNGGTVISEIYLNDGTGVYTLDPSVPFVGVQGVNSAIYCDIDNDNDPDVLISGKDNANQKTAKLYENNGSGTFTEITPTNLLPFYNGSAMFMDLNQDGFKDLITTGNQLGTYSGSYYINDGTGGFDLVLSTPCIGVYTGGAAFADFNGDNYPDIFTTGASGDGYKKAELYFNDGTGNFWLVSGTPFTGIQEGAVDVADINGDTYIDIILTGLAAGSSRITKLYTNDGAGNFTEVIGTPFPGVENGSVEFGDYDNDLDQDILLTGFTGSSPLRVSKLYENDGAGVYTEVVSAVFPGVQGGWTTMEDYDDDGFQDILLTGYVNGVVGEIARLYLGDGVGNFTEQLGLPFEGVIWSSTDAADVDGDNDLDIIITGENNLNVPSTKLFLNDGNANFTEDLNASFENVADGATKFVDLNGDNAEDLMITGLTLNEPWSTNFYLNDGSGGFNLYYGLPIEDVKYSALAFADIDLDSDTDLLICGIGHTSIHTRIYKTSACTANGITPLTSILQDYIDTCEVTTLPIPLAISNCGSAYEGTPDVSLPLTTAGTTVVTWSFDDGNGNTTTQTQNVIVIDDIVPVEDSVSLSEITAECEVTNLVAPTATDNCAGLITGTPDVTFPISTQGTTVVTWTYDDGNGNITTQTQSVVITDTTAPIPDIPSLSDITEDCEVTSLTPPTATDNCGGSVTVTSDAVLPINAIGTTVVTWIYDDGNGNTSTQTQNVIINELSFSASMVDDTTITADQTGDAYQWIDCDNGNQPIAGETNQTFNITDNGNYAVVVTVGNCSDTSNCLLIDYMGFKDVGDRSITIYPNPTVDGVFTIDYDGQVTDVKILDFTGRVIEVPVNLSSKLINASTLSSGTYFVQFSIENGYTQKLEFIITK